MTDHMEEELLKALSRVLLANTLHGVVVFSPDGPCLWANGLAADIAGVSAVETMKHGLSESLWGEGLEEDARQATVTGEPVSREVRLDSFGAGVVDRARHHGGGASRPDVPGDAGGGPH